MKKEIKHILFLFGIVLFVNPIFAQNHAIDSLKQVLNTGKEDTNEVSWPGTLRISLASSSGLGLRCGRGIERLVEE